MRFSAAFIAAAAAFLPLIEAHLFMDMPGYYGTGDNMPPLEESGANFPCSVGDFSKIVGTPPVYTPGQADSIRLKGTAIHSGGSCQVSITYDSPPTKNSQWRVMKSWIGACPQAHDGNLDMAKLGITEPTQHQLSPLAFTVTAGLHKGAATIAWTWFNKTGRREMYMRCYKAEIAGSETSPAVFNSLPVMFRANSGNGCTTAEGEVKFPTPGGDTVDAGTGVAPIGTCGTAAGTPVQETPAQKEAPAQQAPQVPLQQAPPASGGACSPGQKACSGSTWSMCANGVMVNMGALAAGTDCGAIMGKRSIRFSQDHLAKRAL